MTIFLCGFMGCGKTTVGEILAKQLGLPLIDTDAYIVEQEGRSIPEIFAQEGEPYFRKVEAQAIRTLCTKNAVIACGGICLLQFFCKSDAVIDGFYLGNVDRFPRNAVAVIDISDFHFCIRIHCPCQPL